MRAPKAEETVSRAKPKFFAAASTVVDATRLIGFRVWFAASLMIFFPLFVALKARSARSRI